jgi:hypothetical protein
MDDSQSFEVWREGYSMNGATYPAIKLGAVEAKDFDNQIEASKSHAQK